MAVNDLFSTLDVDDPCKCCFVVEIDERQCIGDSLPIINYNFSILEEQVCKALRGGMPAGIMGMFMGPVENIPCGFDYANGDSCLIEDRPALFEAIGYLHGGSGASFCKPDARGLFMRGIDGGSGCDKNVGQRKDPKTGAFVGDRVGTIQEYAQVFQPLRIRYTDCCVQPITTSTRAGETDRVEDVVARLRYTTTTRNASVSLGTQPDLQIGNEVRPKNMSYVPIISNGCPLCPDEE